MKMAIVYGLYLSVPLSCLAIRQLVLVEFPSTTSSKFLKYAHLSLHPCLSHKHSLLSDFTYVFIAPFMALPSTVLPAHE
jgi:hypothetical protein